VTTPVLDGPMMRLRPCVQCASPKGGEMVTEIAGT